MNKLVFFLCIVAMGGLLVSPVFAENPQTDDLQALKEQLDSLNEIVQSQQKQIEEQQKKLQRQEMKIEQQERTLLDLEESVEEPIPYANVDAIVEQVKAELPPQKDGFTIGGGKIRITPYGFLRLDMKYDDSSTFMFSGNVVGWVWPEGGSDATPFPIPPLGIDNAVHKEDDSSFAMTATATRIGLNFDGPEFANGNIRGKLEVDFDELSENGGDVVAHRIRMRHAYAELVYPTWSLLAGQTWDVVAPRIPYMLDCVVLWGSGNVGYRRPQLRLTKWWDVDGTKLTAQGSINHTDRNLLDDQDQDLLLNGVEAAWPMIEGRIGLDTVALGDRKLSLGLSGLIAEEETDLDRPGNKKDLDVWLVALDGQVDIIPGLLSVQGEIWTGENIDNIYGGILQGFANIRDGAGAIVDLEEVEAYGGFVHAMLTPRPGLLFNAGYGVDDPDTKDLGFGNRRLNYTVFGNVIYTVVPNFDIGLELAYHKTNWIQQEDGDDIRVQTAFIYKF